MIGEWVVIFMVAVVVFKPSHLPAVAANIATIVQAIETIKQKFHRFWQTQLQQHQLEKNIIEAEKIDAVYNKNIRTVPGLEDPETRR